MSSQPSMRILIVEDDRTSRIVLRRVLEGIGGLEVIEAEDGLRAWEMLDHGLLADLCFADINMPRMNGLELLKRVRTDKRLAALKVCFCSSVRDRQTIIQAAAYQPDFYVLKPYTRALIQEQVQKARGASSNQESLESAEAVCARLGIDISTYFVLLDSLLTELRTLASRAANLLTHLDIPGALQALDRARSAAQTLGARRVCNLTDNLARLFKSGQDISNQVSGDTEGPSAVVSMWLTASTAEFLEHIQELNRESEVLERASQDRAKAHGILKPNTGAAGTPAQPDKPELKIES